MKQTVLPGSIEILWSGVIPAGGAAAGGPVLRHVDLRVEIETIGARTCRLSAVIAEQGARVERLIAPVERPCVLVQEEGWIHLDVLAAAATGPAAPRTLALSLAPDGTPVYVRASAELMNGAAGRFEPPVARYHADAKSALSA